MPSRKKRVNAPRLLPQWFTQVKPASSYSLGQRMQVGRIRAGLTPLAAANGLSLALPTLLRWEADEGGPSVDWGIRIAALYQVSAPCSTPVLGGFGRLMLIDDPD